ncbi:hypothetical protein PENSPDRAFT_591369 [Peniophora sp. CONT]|nr:hypothetical protein PENSPDRAFT_591369 [Peniophora sp. CONT]
MRRRTWDTGSSRDNGADRSHRFILTEAAEALCANTGNEVISCFPTADSTVPQHELAIFVWNSRRPQLAQTNLVNIYMFRVGDSTPLLSWINQTNPTNGDAGTVAAQVNDTWFPNSGLNWSGSNQTSPYYFILTRNDEQLDGSVQPQPTFTAVQTTIADSVSSSLASVSAASTASLESITNSASRSVASVSAQSTASVASVSSASVASASGGSGAAGATSTASAGASGGGDPNGGVQRNSGSNFPHWAIAVIVVLGFLAIVAIGILFFLIMRRIRQRKAYAANTRNSMGSSSPMIPPIVGAVGSNGEPQSPQMEERGAGLYDPAAAASVHSPQRDDASLASHSQSGGHSMNDPGLFSGADAAIMADAFRKVLRKPDFAGRPIEEGDSPDSQEAPASGEGPAGTNRLMNWELAEEGRDIRSVGSSRGVHVETHSNTDDASTIH